MTAAEVAQPVAGAGVVLVGTAAIATATAAVAVAVADVSPRSGCHSPILGPNADLCLLPSPKLGQIAFANVRNTQKSSAQVLQVAYKTFGDRVLADSRLSDRLPESQS